MPVLLPVIFILFGLMNALALFTTDAVLGSILVIFFMLTLPGLLLLSVFGMKQNSFWETISLSVGLSISIIMLIGLGNNSFLPQYGVSYPLTKIPILISLDTTLLILFGTGLFKHRY